MSDQGQPPNGAAPPEPKQSLRDIAEAAYDEVVEQADSEDTGEQPPAEPVSGERQRDERGRFVARTPEEGEAAAETPPSPSQVTQEPEQPHPAPEQPAPGVAAQAPANWSAEDRANFEKLPPEGKNFLLKRHSEMEGDYQRRVQAATYSNQFVNAVAPVFDDPVIVDSLRSRNQTPIDAVYEWASIARRAANQDDNARIELLFELADRMQLDPAVVFGRINSGAMPPSFTPEEMANPAVKKFADHFGFLNEQLRAANAALANFTQTQTKTAVAGRRAEIDSFANAKNADGSPAHPYFDAVLPIVMEHFKASPNATIEQCYNAAIQPLLQPMQAALKADEERRQNLARAQAATRSNVRGITAPVAKPAAAEGKRSLRDTLEATADEVGFNG